MVNEPGKQSKFSGLASSSERTPFSHSPYGMQLLLETRDWSLSNVPWL
jgi:hypothetical protein